MILLDWLFPSIASRRRIRQARSALAQKIASAPPEFTTTIDTATQAQYDTLTSLSATDLVRRITARQVTAESVVIAYGRNLLAAHAKTNCLTDVFLDNALDRAKAIDQKLAGANSAQPTGRLLGVPITVKDNLLVVGSDACIGYSTLLFKPATRNAAVVDIMLREGAIVLGTTNVPQFMLSFECSNPVFGTTTHPMNAKYSPGGSSGGEAACVSMRGSAFGVGNDVGGSLRTPAHFCGLYTLKCTAGRFTAEGHVTSTPGIQSILAVQGPIARSIDDIDLYLRINTDPAHVTRDPLVVPIPYRGPQPVRPLRIGYYTTDGYAYPTPAVKRAVMQAVRALATHGNGHTLIPIKVPYPLEFMRVAYGLLLQDGCQPRFNLATNAGDPVDRWAQPLVRLLRLWSWVRRLLAWTLAKRGEARSALFLRMAGAKPLGHVHALQADKDRFMYAFDGMWRELDLDLIVCPVTATPAIPHCSFADLAATASHTVLYNVVDYPTGVVPVTVVDRQVDGYGGKQAEADAEETVDDRVHQMIRKHYDADKMHGLPVGVQVVARRFQEEMVVMGMREVERCLKADKKA